MFYLYLVAFFASGLLAKADDACGEVFMADVPQEDIDIIVDKHNYLRELIMNGSVPGQPQGKNLLTISWDEQLASAAQDIANTCVFQHVKVDDDRFYVGQNLAWDGSTVPRDGANWDGAIQMWFDEYKNYTYPDIGPAGHYTQVVWGNTYLIGCGFVSYKVETDQWYSRMYVCNYGPGGNIVGTVPYELA